MYISIGIIKCFKCFKCFICWRILPPCPRTTVHSKITLIINFTIVLLSLQHEIFQGVITLVINNSQWLNSNLSLARERKNGGCECVCCSTKKQFLFPVLVVLHAINKLFYSLRAAFSYVARLQLRYLCLQRGTVKIRTFQPGISSSIWWILLIKGLF